MLHRLAAALGVAITVLTCFAQTTRQTSSEETGADIRTLKLDFEQQWKKGDWSKAQTTLDAAYAADAAQAHTFARTLLTTGSQAVRPLAAGAIAHHAPLEQLAELSRKLSPVQAPDERRLFVRALGTRALNAESTRQVIDIAKSFVDDPDANVAAAAILSLADTNDSTTIGLFIHRLIDVPSTSTAASDNDRQIIACATMGAFEHLSGEQPQSINEAKTWWNQAKNAGGRMPSPKAPPQQADQEAVPRRFAGQAYYTTEKFNVFYRLGSSQKPAEDGPLALRAIEAALEKSTREAMDAFAPVVGKPHIPTMRLYLCDPAQFNAKAGNASFAGVTRGYEVVIKADVPRSMPSTIWHEYIHVIHNCNFVNQPRWLAEGIAMSFTLSPSARASRPGLAADRSSQPAPQTGAFTDMINWNSGGSGDSKEASRYATAHLCVDYLRFGGFGASNERLAFLMGQISRRKGAKAALEDVYGKSIKDLDAGLREWSQAK
ncbi:MAG: hypothetical protein NTV94_16250 [Planctomycetota bacterium]|nr:hypothetical protein [Planctomycetota bacterium]